MELEQLARSRVEPAGEPPAHFVASIAPQLQQLQAAAAEFAEAETIEDLASIVTTAAKDGVHADMLLFGVIHDEGGRHLRAVHAQNGRDAARAPAAIRIEGEGVLAQVARTAQPAYVRQLADVAAERPGTGALAVLPVPAGHEPFAVMVLSRPRPAFGADDRAFLSVLTELCAHAAERVTAQRSRTESYVRVGRMEIDLEQLQISIDGRSVSLTPSEIRLLMFLAKEPGRARTRREILSHVWHTEHVGEERACDVHVSNLRRKLEADPSRPELVITVRGIGYALQVSPA